MLDFNQKVYKALRDSGVDFAVSVPCKLLSGMIDCLEKDSEIVYTPVTREEEGMGLCAGAALAGKYPCIFMQNTGLGNSVNALVTLIQHYNFPLLLFISYRGTPGEKVGTQVSMAVHTKPLLDQMKIPYYHFSQSDDISKIDDIISQSKISQGPVAILTDFNFWKGDQ